MFEKEAEDRLRDIATNLKRAYDTIQDSGHQGSQLLPSSEFYSFVSHHSDRKIAAVDGSSNIVLDAGTFLISIFRAGYVIFQRHNLVGESISQMRPELISIDNLSELYDSIALECFPDIRHTHPPNDIKDTVQRVRVIIEWRQCQLALDKLDEGDILLLDGTIHPGIKFLESISEKILDAAKERGINVVGISKRSTLEVNSLPLVPVAHKLAKLQYPDSHWFYRAVNERTTLAQTLVVQYEPLSSFAFRTDVNSHDISTYGNILGALADHSREPSYMGYPYPLAIIHNRVIIQRADAEHMKSELERAAIEKGISPDDWGMLFLNFHDLLDAGV